MEIDRDLYPLPDVKFVKNNLTKITNKAEAATNNSAKKRDAKDMETAESMLHVTDGLSQHIGFPKPRGCTSIVIWLIKAKTDFAKDVFLDTLLT